MNITMPCCRCGTSTSVPNTTTTAAIVNPYCLKCKSSVNMEIIMQANKTEKENYNTKSYLKSLLWDVEKAISDHYSGSLGYISWQNTPAAFLHFIGHLAKAAESAKGYSPPKTSTKEQNHNDKVWADQQAEVMANHKELFLRYKALEEKHELALTQIAELKTVKDKTEEPESFQNNNLIQMLLVDNGISNVLKDVLPEDDYAPVMTRIRKSLSSKPNIAIMGDILDAAVELVEGPQDARTTLNALYHIVVTASKFTKF